MSEEGIYNRGIYTADPSQMSKMEHKFEDKQYGYCWFDRVADGFNLRVQFSNGKRFDGDHFACHVIVRDADDRPLSAVKFKVGINGTFGIGSAKEREFTQHINLSQQQLGLVHHFQFEFFQYQGSDDTAIWNAIKTLIEAIIKDGGEDSPPPPKSSREREPPRRD